MTNEQLYAFILILYDQLNNEIDRLRQQLPEAMEKHEPISLLGEKEDGDFVVLDGLRHLTSLYYRQMVILSGEKYLNRQSAIK